MSKIVSPLPPLKYDAVKTREPGMSWWRLRLRPNEDGELYVVQLGGHDGDDLRTATWASWTIFDGADDILDAGFDKPLVAIRLTETEDFPDLRVVVDVLHPEPPTSSPFWEKLTEPDSPHPDDRAGHPSGHPSGRLLVANQTA